MAASPGPAPASTTPPFPIGTALRRALAAGYGWRELGGDLLAGCVVGVVALPLSMALAIATGVAPQYGLYTAIVAGALIALLGGSPVQVSGPTAAFVVILAPITSAYGMAGLLVASMLAGLLLITLGIARLGRLIEFVPYPVTTGFTAGIAVVIATMQVRDLLGLEVGKLPLHFLERVAAIVRALPTLHWTDALVGAVTFSAILLTTRYARRIPGALVGVPLGAAVALVLGLAQPAWQAETIQSRFGGVPQTPPAPTIPWLAQDPAHDPLPLSWGAVQGLLLSSFAIAMLGAIESLLSAVVAAGMSGGEHDPDAELVAQGIGNVVAPFFGGFAATGALARTAANVRNGARSPLAAVFHALFLLAAILAAAPLLGYIPMASMAALLVVVAWNMSDARHVVHTLRVAPRGDKVVLILCLVLTVAFDMAVAVTVGVVLAALIFMQRMARLTGVQLVQEQHAAIGPLPPHVLVYEVSGPLFFGAAARAMSILKRVDHTVSVVVLNLRSVPVLDQTGLVALESALGKLHQAHIYTIVAGLQAQPMELLAKAGWGNREWLCFYPSFEEGLAIAKTLGELLPPALRPPVPPAK